MTDWAGKGWSEEKRARVRLIKSKSIGERLVDQAVRDQNDCLVWTGLKDVNGYGKISYKSKYWRCHRLIYVLTNGEPPDGLQVLHRCDNRACFNLNHLFLGTQNDNMVDMGKKGRGNSVLTSENVAEILTGNESTIALAKKFGVRHQIVSAVRNGRSWKYHNARSV
jgi:hypothetical protein